jgi:hypothetical protein
MRLVQIFMLASAVLLPTAAAAVDVDLGARVEAVYDSNVFRTSSDEKQDGSFRFTPTIRVEAANSKLGGSILYEPTYEVFTTYSDANDLTHLLVNTFDWAPSEKTDLTWVNSFQAVDVLNFGDPDTIDEGTEVIPSNDIERDRIYLFGSGLSVAHALSPRWTSNSDLTYNLFEPERRNSVASNSIRGFQTFSYGLTAADSLGAGGGITAQFFDEVQTLPASKTFVYQMFATYVRNFGESTTLSLRLGPAAIHTIQDSASGSTTQTFPSDRDGNDFLVSNPARCVTNARPPTSMDPVLWEGSRCAKNTRITMANDPVAWAALDAAGDTELNISGSNKGSNGVKWTVFGEISLTHLWTPTLASTVSYNRSENTANGDGGSAIADTVLFAGSLRPTFPARSSRWRSTPQPGS